MFEVDKLFYVIHLKADKISKVPEGFQGCLLLFLMKKETADLAVSFLVLRRVISILIAFYIQYVCLKILELQMFITNKKRHSEAGLTAIIHPNLVE